ncbi:hypothetical protein ES705_40265 [subsurface metagenome]
MIEDFIDELKKEFGVEGMPTGHKEIHEFVHTIYTGIKGGEVRNCVQMAVFKFIKSIKPDIPKEEMVKGVTVIESIIETVFCMLVSEGVLTKVKSESGDKIVIHWEKKGVGGDRNVSKI